MLQKLRLSAVSGKLQVMHAIALSISLHPFFSNQIKLIDNIRKREIRLGAKTNNKYTNYVVKR